MIGKLLKLAAVSFCAVFAFFFYKIAFRFPALVETVYSRKIYPALSKLIGSLTSTFSFSAAEILLYLFAVSVIFFTVYTICAFFKPAGLKLYTVGKRILTFLIMLCMIYTMFVFSWGLNYARLPLADSMGIETTEYSTEELKQTCEVLMTRVNALRKQVAEDENGIFQLSITRENILEGMGDIYAAYAPDYMNLAVKSQVKKVFTKNLLSYTLTTGVYSPFTFEANINMQMPDLFFAPTAAHEYAHLQGFAREDEANFIAWYVLSKSDNIDFAYSANAFALSYCLNALGKASFDDYTILYQSLFEGVKRDYIDHASYWDGFKSEISEKSKEIYDSYLSTNGVKDGIQSYGRMIDLIIALNNNGTL